MSVNKFYKLQESKSSVNQFYAEDEEVEGRDPREDLSLFQATCDDIRSSMAEIKRLKDSSRSTVVCYRELIMKLLEVII